MNPRERLFALEQFGIKLGLENITALLAALHQPQQAWRSVHVAGTNGKGSVTAMVERGLRAAGHQTGRYTSPHLDRIEERIAIDGESIESSLFDDITRDVFSTIDQLRDDDRLPVTPTFFEATTAIAFEAFRRLHVDVAVIEVGLGGRFDATNVLTPAVTVITSIAFDHERHLGTTLPEIAFEKAGIIKPGIPIVIGALPQEAFRVIRDRAEQVAAPLVMSNVSDVAGLTIRLQGAHQRLNAAVAVKTLQTCAERGIPVSHVDAVTALRDVEWPARLEWLRVAEDKAVLLDAAHNPAGAEALADYLTTAGIAPLPIVIAVMKDKNVDGLIRPLASVASRLIVTQVESSRSMSAADLEAEISRIVPAVPTTATTSPLLAIDLAFRDAPQVAIAGSIFLVGPTRARLLEAGATVILR